MTEVWLRGALWLGLALSATLIFAAATALVIGVLPWITPRFFRAFGGRPSELEAKYLLLVLFALGGLAKDHAGSFVSVTALVAAPMAVGGLLVAKLVTKTFGLTHNVIDQAQYSYLIAAVIGSAVVPTLVANAFFVPRYLLPKVEARASSGPRPSAVAVSEGEG